MVPKRHFHDEGGSQFAVPFRESKRRPLFKTWVILDWLAFVASMCNFSLLCWLAI